MYYLLAFVCGVIGGFVAGYLFGGRAVKSLKDTVGKL